MAKIDFKNIRFQPKNLLHAVLVVLVLATVVSSFFIVDETEQAVITRFGRYHSTLDAGLRFKIPFIDKKFKVPTKVVQTEQFGFRTIRGGTVSEEAKKSEYTSESTMLTGDLNIVDVEWIIQYRIVDPAAWLFNVNDRVSTIRDISRSVVNMLVGDRSIFDVMGPGRTEIETRSMELMNENFKQFNLGISVIAVRLQNIVPPEGVQAAFEDVNKAVQDMNRFINEGREAYNAEIPKARGEADQLVQVAQGYAGERVNRAKGDVARFNAVYDEYRRAPAVTRQRLYLEMMDSVFAESQKSTIIDKNVKNVIPLKNLNGGAQQ
jgi:membrane protease subunit HflK